MKRGRRGGERGGREEEGVGRGGMVKRGRRGGERGGGREEEGGRGGG